MLWNRHLLKTFFRISVKNLQIMKKYSSVGGSGSVRFIFGVFGMWNFIIRYRLSLMPKLIKFFFFIYISTKLPKEC